MALRFRSQFPNACFTFTRIRLLPPWKLFTTAPECHQIEPDRVGYRFSEYRLSLNSDNGDGFNGLSSALPPPASRLPPRSDPVSCSFLIFPPLARMLPGTPPWPDLSPPRCALPLPEKHETDGDCGECARGEIRAERRKPEITIILPINLP